MSADMQYVWCGRRHGAASHSLLKYNYGMGFMQGTEWLRKKINEVLNCFYAKRFLGVAESETALRSKALCPAPAHSAFLFFYSSGEIRRTGGSGLPGALWADLSVRS